MSINVEHITKRYGKQLALDDVSFQIGAGEIVGFLGPNGAGKSTMMKILTGFLPPTSGEATVNGLKMNLNQVEARRDIGYLPEHNALYGDLYIKEYLSITAGFYRITNKKKRVAEMIEMTGLGPEQDKKIRRLSNGYRQRVGLAQALIHNPSTLILDEPTTGLDPIQLEEIRRLIKEISKDKTVMLSSHIMQEVEAVCSRVLIINRGQIVADGSVEAFKNHNLSADQQVLVEFSENPMKSQLLNIEGVMQANNEGKSWLLTASDPADIRPAIFRFAVENNLTILTLREQQKSLEHIFREITDH